MDEYFTALQNQIAQNNAWSAEQAQKQMDFQERLSNTAHQREIEDLKAAGLNPVLSARLGGASTPSGAMSTADPSGTSAMASLMSQMIQSQGDTARTALRVASGSGFGYGSGAGSSAFTIGTKENTTFINGLLQLLGEGLPSDAKKGVAYLYENADQIADSLGLPKDNKDGYTTVGEMIRNYLTDKWTIGDTINAVKDFIRAYSGDKENVENPYNNDLAKDYKEGKEEVSNYIIDKVSNFIDNAVDSVKSVFNSGSSNSSSTKEKITNSISKAKSKIKK